MSPQAVHEYLIMVWHQYQEASRREKTALLDEAARITGYHRKSLIRLLSRATEPTFGRGKGKSANSYSDESKRLLKKLCSDMARPGAKHMKGAIPKWIDNWDSPDMDDYVRGEIKQMSASTIEGTLKEEKSKLRRRLNTGTKRGKSKMQTQIPIRDLESKPTEPGHCEIDCVAHCGGSLTGEHIWTLTVTDIVLGWTECEALQFKNGWEVKLALDRIEDRLPFSLIALYMDNGSEFLNADVQKRFAWKKNKIDRQTLIELFRSRPYKKNDQCYVEQKNYTHVRELFGYDRYSGKLMVQLMNNIYRKQWRILKNVFSPQIRLESKERVGSKVKRTFHDPAMPIDMLAKFVSDEKMAELKAEYDAFNPFELVKKLKRKLREFQAYNNRSWERLGKYAI